MEIKMEIYKARVCELIKKKGNHIHSERGMQFYGMMSTVDNAIKAFNHISHPKLSILKNRFNLKGNIFCGFSITNDNNIYSAVYIKLVKDSDECQLLSFYNHEESGWYLDMMAMMKVLVKRLQYFRIRVLRYRFHETWPIATYVEKVFNQFGKTEVKVSHYLCVMEDTKPLLDSPWTNRPIPEDCTIEDWSDTSYTQLEEAFRDKRFQNIPQSMQPFQLRDQFSPKYSSLIKYKGEIIGWCIIHLLGKEKLQITALYIDHHKGSWLGLRSLSTATLRIFQKENKFYKATFLIEGKNTPMYRFYEKVLRPMGCKVTVIKEITLIIF